MPEERPRQFGDDLELLELLLQQQHEALLRDDFDAVEGRSNEIVAIITALRASGDLPAGTHLERIRSLNKQMIYLLAAKKEIAAAELSTTRNKLDLNKSYRVYDE
jgi:hypothetical protein